MKNIVFGVILLLLLFSCEVKTKVNSRQLTTQEKLNSLQTYLFEGVILDDQRPMENILSEQEVLLKAADYAVNEGVFDPNFYLYKNHPELLTAKIEAPILVHGPDGSPVIYMLHAVDKNGSHLMFVYVKCDVNAQDDEFVTIRTEPLPGYNERGHYITKREIKAFLKNRFEDKIVSEPVAISGIRLEESPYSNIAIFWYFTTENNSAESSVRSVTPSIEEYLIDAFVTRYTPPKDKNKAFISAAYRGSPHLGGARMVKLLTPLKPNFTNDGRGEIYNIFDYEPLKYIYVPIDK
jgi:hypothetical protein